MFSKSLKSFGTRFVIILSLLGGLVAARNVQAARMEPDTSMLILSSGTFPSVVVTSPANGDVLLNNPSGLTVKFSTNMLANGTAYAANLPGNYLLVEAGADGKFQTASCITQRAGDDTQVTIKSVAYNSSTYTSTLTVENWPTLNQANYQLLVCGSTRMTDTAGNRLNDGTDSKVRFVLLKDVDLYPYTNLGGGDGKGAGIGDFNHDGLPDVAMSIGLYTSQLLVFLQGNDGTWAAPVSYPAGSRSEALAVGDLNHDGWMDVTTADFSTNTISVFLQQADGTLAPRITYATSSGPDSIAVGDVTGDGLQDVVVSHWNDPSIGVYVQNANGTLSPMKSYTARSAGGDDLAIGDVNHDGRNDVVNMDSSPNLSVYLQNANGTLDAAVIYTHTCSVCSGTGGVAIGDVTGDGLADVVVSLGGNSPNARIALFAQSASGQLQTSVLYNSYDIPGPAEIADINHDGALDVLLLHDGWRTLGVYLQKGGQLQPESLYSIPNINQFNPQGLAIGDINLDGAMDVAIADDIYGMTVLYYHERTVPHVIQGGNTSPVDGEEVGEKLSQVSIQFDRPMKADGSASAVNTLSNYLLVESGLDGSFQTGSCTAGPTGDDAMISFQTVQYDPARYFATLSLNGGSLLGAGKYRLLVCSAMEDADGGKLNGGVSDQAINFTIWPAPHKISGNAGTAKVVLSYYDNGPRSVIADYMGDYSLRVSDNWSGTVTPSRANFTFSPVSKSYTGVSTDLANENYTASLIMFTVSGNTGMGNVPIYSNPPGNVIYSDAYGNYSLSVPSGWTFSIYPSGVAGYRFIPESRLFSNIQSNQTNQDFTPQRTYTIYGNAGAPGVALNYLDGTPRVVTTDSYGNYWLTVPEHWSGTVIPAKSSYRFTPSSKVYTDVVTDLFSQDYTATVVVTNTNNSGPGSLRQAIADAASGATIYFDPALAGGTISLASQLDINKDLTIDGSGLSPRVAISGNNAVRILNIGSNYTVALNSLILRDGFMTGTSYTYFGGAIFANSGTLNITDVAFIGNKAYDAGALYISPYANVTIQKSEFTSNSATLQGGAIYVQSLGNLTVNKSRLQNNSALTGTGGAIYLAAAGTRLLENNTFSGNSAVSGGAVLVEQTSNSNVTVRKNTFVQNVSTSSVGAGGALYVSFPSSGPATLTVENNTFYSNQAANIGGAVYSEGTTIFRNNTFSHNRANKTGGNAGGSLYLVPGFGISLYNNIIANNTGGGECAQGGYNYITGSNNLVEDGSLPCASLPGTIISDPLLSDITDNGGFSDTMAIWSDSPAVDTGNDTNCPATDQRWLPRISGIHCDIGAFEYQAPPPATPSPTFTFTATVPPTYTPTFTPTYTPTYTYTPTNTPTTTATPTATKKGQIKTPTNTPTGTSVVTNTPTQTPKPIFTPTKTPVPTKTPRK